MNTSRLVRFVAGGVGAVLVAGCSSEINDPFVVAQASDSSTVAPAAPSADGAEAASAAPASASFGVGDSVQVDDWVYTVHSVTDPFPQTEFSIPEEGNRFFGIDAEVTYNGSEPGQVVSSLVCFDLQDSTNRSFVITLGPNNDVIDGDVQPGGARRGTIVWEIPVDATGLRVSFKCDFLTGGIATFDLF